jgi:hypothetical protein
VLPLLSSTILRGMMDEQPASVLDLELAADGAIVCVKGAVP